MALSDDLYGNIARKTNTNSLRMARPKTTYRPRAKSRYRPPSPRLPSVSRSDQAMFNAAKVQQQQAVSRRTIVARQQQDPSDRAMINAARIQQQTAQQRSLQLEQQAQTQWLRYRNPQTAVQDMLQPGVLEAMGGKLPIRFGGITEAPAVQRGLTGESTIVLPPLGTGGPMKADDVRHELWHYVTQNAGKLPFQALTAIPLRNLWAESKTGAFISELLGKGIEAFEIRESAAISFGGGDAYPGFGATFDPMEFLDIFNPNVPSWNYEAGK